MDKKIYVIDFEGNLLNGKLITLKLTKKEVEQRRLKREKENEIYIILNLLKFKK